MADAAIGTDTTNGGNTIIAGDQSGAIVVSGYINTATTIKPGHCVTESGTSTSTYSFNLCNNTEETNVAGIVLEDPTKDIDTAFAASSYVRVAVGNCICRCFNKENIAATNLGDIAIVSAEDGIVQQCTVGTNTDVRLVVGKFMKYVAKDTQYLTIQHVYIP
jgi:hypothetical protein